MTGILLKLHQMWRLQRQQVRCTSGFGHPLHDCAVAVHRLDGFRLLAHTAASVRAGLTKDHPTDGVEESKGGEAEAPVVPTIMGIAGRPRRRVSLGGLPGAPDPAVLLRPRGDPGGLALPSMLNWLLSVLAVDYPQAGTTSPPAASLQRSAAEVLTRMQREIMASTLTAPPSDLDTVVLKPRPQHAIRGTSVSGVCSWSYNSDPDCIAFMVN
jgi:hypothetical protein